LKCWGSDEDMMFWWVQIALICCFFESVSRLLGNEREVQRKAGWLGIAQ
jgi:hypothetical protein